MAKSSAMAKWVVVMASCVAAATAGGLATACDGGTVAQEMPGAGPHGGDNGDAHPTDDGGGGTDDGGATDDAAGATDDGGGPTDDAAGPGDDAASADDLSTQPPPDFAGVDLAGKDLAKPADLSVPKDLHMPPHDMAMPADPCAMSFGDGFYCAASLKAGNAPVLYHCVAKKTVSKTTCAHGCTVEPKGTPDQCAPGPMTGPPGKGIWIWTFASNAGPPAQIAAKAKSLGIGFVLIKSGEDTQTYTGNFSAANVKEFTSRGIEVYGWPYVRPGNLAAKADAIAQQAKVPGVKGIILDVETEFNKHPADATALCQAIRARAPGVFLGYTSFGWVDYHLDFPFAQFDAGCGDAFLPQTYWDEWGSCGPTCGLAKGTTDYKKHGWKAPIWPAQDNYNNASVAGMNQFFDAAGPHASLWRWPDPSRTDLLNQLPQLHWKNN